MLSFLFSFCNTSDDAILVKPKDKELLAAFEMTQELANEPDTPLRGSLDLAWVMSATIRSCVS